MTEQRKAVIKNADMSETMQQDAVDIASQALSKYNIEKVRCGRVKTQACRVACAFFGEVGRSVNLKGTRLF
jgi:hypothetical protein